MIHFARISCLLLLVGCASAKPYNPNDPRGYSSYHAKNGVGTFVVPESWHVLEAENSDSKVLFISKEDLEKELRYHTGISINQISHWSKHDSRKPAAYAVEAANSVRSFPLFLKNEVIPNELSPLQSATFQNNLRDGLTKTKLFFMGIDDLDVVYVINFTAPAKDFDREWILGNSIVENARFGE